MRKHLRNSDLALYAGGDLGFWRGLMASAHVRGCSTCRAEAEAFRDARQALRQDRNSMPPGLDWDRLATEMKANIRLGVEAGECVGPVLERPARRVPWMPVAAMALVASVFVTVAWWQARTLRPQFQANVRPALASGEVVLKATMTAAAGAASGEIGVERNGETLTLLHQGSAADAVSIGVQGSLNARYIDDDSGQVTIHHVYTE